MEQAASKYKCEELVFLNILDRLAQQTKQATITTADGEGIKIEPVMKKSPMLSPFQTTGKTDRTAKNILDFLQMNKDHAIKNFFFTCAYISQISIQQKIQPLQAWLNNLANEKQKIEETKKKCFENQIFEKANLTERTFQQKIAVLEQQQATLDKETYLFEIKKRNFELELLKLEKEKASYYDTVILCRDNEHFACHLHQLSAIPFFQIYIRNKMKKQNHEDNPFVKLYPNCKHAFEITDYPKSTLSHLFNYHKKPCSLKNIKNNFRLLELRSLAYYFGSHKLANACGKQIIKIGVQNKFNFFLTLLLQGQIPIKDYLLQSAFAFLSSVFQDLSRMEQFREVPANYLKKIIERDDLQINSETELLNVLRLWAGKEYIKKLTEKDGNDSLMDYVRLEYLTEKNLYEIQDEGLITIEEYIQARKKQWQSDINTAQRPFRPNLLVEEGTNGHQRLRWRINLDGLSPEFPLQVSFNYANRGFLLQCLQKNQDQIDIMLIQKQIQAQSKPYYSFQIGNLPAKTIKGSWTEDKSDASFNLKKDKKENWARVSPAGTEYFEVSLVIFHP